MAPRRHRVGGIYAALAMRGGLGKVVKKFPPSVSLTDPERRKVVDMARNLPRKPKGTVSDATPAVPPASPENAAPAASQSVEEVRRVAPGLATYLDPAPGAPSARPVVVEGISGVGGEWARDTYFDALPPQGPKGETSIARLESPKGEEPIARDGWEDRVRRFLYSISEATTLPPSLRVEAFTLLVGG